MVGEVAAGGEERDEGEEPEGEAEADMVVVGWVSVVGVTGTVAGTVVGGTRRRTVTRTARLLSM